MLQFSVGFIIFLIFSSEQIHLTDTIFLSVPYIFFNVHSFIIDHKITIFCHINYRYSAGLSVRGQ